MPVRTFDIDRDRRDIDVSEQIALLEPDETPLTVVLMKARKQKADGAEIVWFEDELGALWTKINNEGGYSAAATDLVVDDASIFAQYDVVKAPRTGEVMLITAVNTATNTITVVRGYGTTAAATLNDDDWMLLIGNAMAEASSAPAEKIGQPVKKTNYAQIFRTPFSVSGTEMAEGVVTNEDERARLSQKKGIEHRVQLEHAILFGEKKEDAANKRRMMAGILSFITSNVYDALGILTEAEFEAFCEMGFSYGSSRKLLVASPKIITVINQWAAGKLEVVSKEETYGVQVRRYLSAHGEVNIVPSKILKNAYSGYAFLLDIGNITYKPLRDTTLKRNIQANDEDAVKDEYFTEAALKVELEKTHAILKGVTG